MIATEELIAVTYTNWVIETGEQWMRIETLANLIDRDRDDLNEAIKSLMTAEGFRAEPEALESRITGWDRTNAPIIGGEARHLIKWS